MHTEGKWEASKSGAYDVISQKDGGFEIARLTLKANPKQSQANAQRIVQCCNLHDDLVEITTRVSELIQTGVIELSGFETLKEQIDDVLAKL